MKVLVATTETQGARDDDFCWAVDGELVYLPFLTCATPGCGCDRAFAGLASSKATTTAMVVERDAIQLTTYALVLRDGLARQGWVADSSDYEHWLADFVCLHSEVATAFPDETIVELRDDHVRARVSQRNR